MTHYIYCELVAASSCNGGRARSTWFPRPRSAGHADAVYLEGDPARVVYPLQECRHIEICFVSVHLVDVGVPGFLQLGLG
jgi:hypothetical protein